MAARSSRRSFGWAADAIHPRRVGAGRRWGASTASVGSAPPLLVSAGIELGDVHERVALVHDGLLGPADDQALGP